MFLQKIRASICKSYMILEESLLYLCIFKELLCVESQFLYFFLCSTALKMSCVIFFLWTVLLTQCYTYQTEEWNSAQQTVIGCSIDDLCSLQIGISTKLLTALQDIFFFLSACFKEWLLLYVVVYINMLVLLYKSKSASFLRSSVFSLYLISHVCLFIHFLCN